ncbi:hypothetical protein Tco_0885048 [Tanacetum coccineum]
MASEHDCLEPELQRFINHNASVETMNTPSKQDLDNLFSPMYEEYFEKKFSDTPINYAAQPTQIHEDSPSISLIIVDEHKAPPIFVPYNPPSHEEIESSTMTLELSNVKNFHQIQPSTHIWTKDHPLDQVIGDPSKPVMTRQRLYTDSEFGNSFYDQKDTPKSSAPKRSTMIHFRLPERRSTRLTPPVQVPTVEKEDEMILQDTLQVSLAKHKSREEQEARENVELVNKHLASEEIEKLVEGSENVIDDSLPPKNDEPQIPDTRLEPRSDKESPEVEKTNDEEVKVTNVVIHISVNKEEKELSEESHSILLLIISKK